MNALDPVQQLLDLEAIKQLKYRYFRLLDMKQFDALAQLMTEDCSCAWDNARYTAENRAEALQFWQESMQDPECMTSHQGHHPEITLIDAEHATGIWHFEDTVLNLPYNSWVTGAGIYCDEYRKVDGQWMIARTAYERLWYRLERLEPNEGRRMRSMFRDSERNRSHARGRTALDEQVFGPLG